MGSHGLKNKSWGLTPSSFGDELRTRELGVGRSLEPFHSLVQASRCEQIRCVLMHSVSSYSHPSLGLQAPDSRFFTPRHVREVLGWRWQRMFRGGRGGHFEILIAWRSI